MFGDPNGPKTQVDELTGTVAAFKNAVNAAADINAKRAVIAEHLLPEMTRAEDRDEVIRELQTLKDQNGVDKLLSRFELIANRATNGERETRSASIADLLYNFEYTDNWHNRVQAVIGLDQYVAAAERQTGRLRDMIGATGGTSPSSRRRSSPSTRPPCPSVGAGRPASSPGSEADRAEGFGAKAHRPAEPLARRR